MPRRHAHSLVTSHASKMTNFTRKIACMSLLTFVLLYIATTAAGEGRKILMFADRRVDNEAAFKGNGFLGAATAELFIDGGDNVTIVNRGNWYWDSKKQILPFVDHIQCDRSDALEKSCPQLMKLIEETPEFDAVIDFSAFAKSDTEESARILQNKVGLYVLISTDSVYDVCDKKGDARTVETDAVRPTSDDEIAHRKVYHQYGHNKLEAEDELLNQRTEGGFPFFILRLPDVIGPKDTTYRFWIYQLWLKLTPLLPDRPVTIPHFLKDYEMSFVYNKDVAMVIHKVLNMGPQIRLRFFQALKIAFHSDQVVNVAWEQTITLLGMLEEMQTALNINGDIIKMQTSEEQNHLYFYPSVRKGPIDVSKALNLLNFQATPFEEAIKESVDFYEDAMKEERSMLQRDEILQVVGHQVYGDMLTKFFEAVEKVYGVDLRHFKNSHDEL